MTVAIEIAGSDRFPSRPRIWAYGPAANQTVPVHVPDRGLAAAGVLPQDVGKAVAVEVAVWGRPNCGRRRNLYVRGEFDRAGGGAVGPKKSRSCAIEGVEFDRPVDGRQVDRIRTSNRDRCP
jgi:hypothetical protein